MAEPLVGGRLAARVQRPDDDGIPDREPIHAGSDLRHVPGHLVSDHLGHLHALVHRSVSDMQIGSADAAVGDVQADFTWAGRHRRRSTESERAPALVVDPFKLARAMSQR